VLVRYVSPIQPNPPDHLRLSQSRCLLPLLSLHSHHNTSSHPQARAPALARRFPCKRCTAARQSLATSPCSLASNPAQARCLPRRRCTTARRRPATSLRPLYDINRLPILQVVTPKSTVLGTPTSPLRTRLAPMMQERDAGNRTIQHSTAKLLPPTSMSTLFILDVLYFFNCCLLVLEVVLA
jgi:hypothetical protein